MCGRHRLLWALLAGVLGLTGCHGGGMNHRSRVGIGPEPGLAESQPIGGKIVRADPIDDDTLLVDGSSSKPKYPNRPLFRKTQEAYDSAQGNSLAKGAKATFVGVPQGIGAEVKQLFTGSRPPVEY